MADFCKIDFRNLNQDSIEEYNAYVNQDIMDDDMFEITFSGISEAEIHKEFLSPQIKILSSSETKAAAQTSFL